MTRKPHLAILGAGPTGLEAALAAADGGYPFTLYEAASEPAGDIASWGHVRLFTPWDLNVSPRMRKHLKGVGQPVPEGDACPTGRELHERVLRPLGDLPEVSKNLRLGTRARRIGRRGLLKHEEIGSAERAKRPFRLLLENGSGQQRIEAADVVLDCTGNTLPNALGDGGIEAPGEQASSRRIGHEIPDLGSDGKAWDGQRVLLIGAGHSAQTAAVRLAPHLTATGGALIWAIRGTSPGWLTPSEDADPLPERARLSEQARSLVLSGDAEIRAGVVLEGLEPNGSGVVVELRREGDARQRLTVDRILALTGRVGDHQLYRQLQVHECYATSGPMKLAAALMSADGGSGDCLDQTSQGADTLKNPEPGFYILGIKSYGRRTDYLMRVGWQQVEEVFELLGR